MSLYHTTEIECAQCDGNGWIEVYRAAGILRGHHQDTCEACSGTGWRAPTADELQDMAETANEEMTSGEPPMSFAERTEINARRNAPWGVK